VIGGLVDAATGGLAWTMPDETTEGEEIVVAPPTAPAARCDQCDKLAKVI
jgi:hypothetical protein